MDRKRSVFKESEGKNRITKVQNLKMWEMNCETYKFSEFDDQNYLSTSVRPKDSFGDATNVE